MSCDHRKGPKTAGLCDPCSPSLRNLYFRGKPITVSDYQIEQRYGIGRRRLINRAMLGWGVVSGFRLKLKEGVLTIGSGLALDRCGHELLACEPVTLDGASDLIWIAPGECGYKAADPPDLSVPPVEQTDTAQQDAKQQADAAQQSQAAEDPTQPEAMQQGLAEAGPADAADHGSGKGDQRPTYVLRAHYAEVEADGIRVEDGCAAAACAFNHLCETVVFSLAREPCASGLPDCRTCARDGDPDAFPRAALPLADVLDRGPQERLCCWSEHWSCDPRICDSCRLTRVGCLAGDLDHGVPLACLRLTSDECGRIRVGEIVPCRTRRLARPNEALFDLVRGCDLTRIDDIGWRNWHALKPGESVSRDGFRRMFDEPPERQGASDDPPEPSRSHFWVRTSGPVQVKHLTPDVFTLNVLSQDDDEGYQSLARIRVREIGCDPTTDGDPPGTTRRFWPLVSGYFYNGEIRGGQLAKFRHNVLVEIMVDGNGVVDAAGQCLDAERRAHDYRSGNGSPGGVFTSRFPVKPKGDAIPPHPDPDPDQAAAAGPPALPAPDAQGEE